MMKETSTVLSMPLTRVPLIDSTVANADDFTLHSTFLTSALKRPTKVFFSKNFWHLEFFLEDLVPLVSDRLT